MLAGIVEETMRVGRWLGVIAFAITLAGCFEASLSKEDEKLFDAVMYLFTGIEDSTKDDYGLTPWRKSVKENGIDYSKIGENHIGSSDEDFNKRIHNSKYVRYIFRLTSPEVCVFRFQDLEEFSKSDSQTEFSTPEPPNLSNSHTFNFANAHRFDLVERGFKHLIVIEGPRVICEEWGSCENQWDSTFSGMSYTRFADDSASVDRRARALALIKKSCPGNEF